LRSGYKQTDVGVIPQDWEVKPFGELFAFRNGVNADKGRYGKGIRFINVLEPITFSHIHGPEIAGRVTLPESIAASYEVKRGDVLFNRTSETQEEVALAATYLGSERVVFGGFVIRGRPTNESLDPIYSGYALRAPFIRSQIIPMGQGAVRANVGQQNLGRVVAPIPPLPEQRAIAGALSDVDALLGALDQLIGKKRDLKQAAMQQLLTGQTRLPGFHGEWESKQLGDIGKFKNGLNKNSGAFGHGSPFVNLMDVFGVNAINSSNHLGLVASTKLDQDVYDLRRGDVLFIRSSVKPSGVGLTAVVECDLPETVYSGFLIRFRDNGLLDLGFKKHCFYGENFRKNIIAASSVSANTNVNQNALGLLTIKLPPTKAEQTAIAEVLSDMDAELAALEQRHVKTQALKQGMMQDLLTGRTRLV